jgi:hypothetical protein
MVSNILKDKIDSEVRKDESGCDHDLEFFDSFPEYEIYQCKKCKKRKFVKDDGEVTWE